MQIPKFWKRASQQVETSKGRSWLLSVWGWSDVSEEAAAELAHERLRAQADAVAAGKPLDRYHYQERGRPLREEVLDRPCPGVVITRNRYGAQILNTEGIAFVDVDVDFPRPKPPPGFFARLFGASEGASREQTIDSTLELLRAALRPQRVSARVYETHSGLRLLLTDQIYDPASEKTQTLLKDLGCDPLYRSLCRQQECFRARLTPKPWRCDLSAPTGRWPYAYPAEEQTAQEWVKRYEAACTSFTTTRYITSLGGRNVHAEVQPVVDLHDRLARATFSGLPLA